MRVYLKKDKNSKYNESNIPNVLAFGFIKSFLTDKKYKDLRQEYFLNNLSSGNINQAMKDVKWLFKVYKSLDIITIENPDGNISKFIL